MPSLHLTPVEVTEDYFEQVLDLFAHTWWTKDREPDQVLRAFRATPVHVGLQDEAGDLVAYARAFSDGEFKALVMDVVVRPNLRSQGVGKFLMETLLSHRLIASVEHVELYCNPARHRFYSDLGFAVETGHQFMRLDQTT